MSLSPPVVGRLKHRVKSLMYVCLLSYFVCMFIVLRASGKYIPKCSALHLRPTTDIHCHGVSRKASVSG